VIAHPTLSDLTRQAAARFSDRLCLVDGERRFSFADFDLACDRLAAALSAGFDPGSRIALFMANRAEYLLLQMAIERAGLVRVPVNARSTVHDLRLIVGDCTPAAIFHDATTAARVAEATGDHGPRAVQVDGDDAEWTRLCRADVAALPAAPGADVLCSLNYTSGSSGRPKGVMLTHRNWLAVARNMLADRDIRAADRVAHIGPLSHASGSYFVPWFLRGASNHLIAGGAVDALLRTIAAERITVFTCVPTALTRIVNHPEIDRHDLSSLRAIGYGAEAIPNNTLDKAIARFGPIMTQNYGQTEAYMTIATLSPEDHFDGPGGTLRAGCIGHPYSFVAVVLRAPDGTPVAPGDVGEITVRSDHVMAGY